MNIVDMLGEVTTVVVAVVTTLISAWLVAVVVTRVLGVQVGRLRALLVGLGVFLALGNTFPWAIEQVTGSPGGFEQMSTPMFLSLGVVVLLWGIAAGAVVLVVLELLVPTSSVPGFREIAMGLGPRLRRGRRYTQVMAIAARHGLSPRMAARVGEATGRHDRLAAALRETLDEAGVTYVKLGQMLSTRADLLPETYVRELSRLQDTATPVPWDRVEPLIVDQFGRPVDEVFEHFDRTPLATASVGQVHRATLPGGRDVVVKVRRPGIGSQVALDLTILERIADTLEATTGWAARFGVRDLVDGFARSMREELDYRVEAANMRAMRPSMDRRGLRVPAVVPELSTATVLVMEYVDGTPVGRAGTILARMPADTRRDAAQTLLDAVVGHIVDEGVFHADLHPGNVLLWRDGSVGLLDFGSVGRLDALTRRHLGTLLMAIDIDDPVLATDALLELLGTDLRIDERTLQREVGMLITRVRSGGPADRAGGMQIFGEVFGLVLEHGLAVPPPIATAFRALAALEGTLAAVSTELEFVEAARRAGAQRAIPKSVSDLRTALLERALSVLPAIERLPRHLDRLAVELERGTLETRVRVVAHEDDRAYLDRLVQQLVTAILAGAAVLGAILLVTSTGGPMLGTNLSLHHLLGYLLGFAGFMLSLRAVALIFGRAR